MWVVVAHAESALAEFAVAHAYLWRALSIIEVAKYCPMSLQHRQCWHPFHTSTCVLFKHTIRRTCMHATHQHSTVKLMTRHQLYTCTLMLSSPMPVTMICDDDISDHTAHRHSRLVMGPSCTGSLSRTRSITGHACTASIWPDSAQTIPTLNPVLHLPAPSARP
jgi:hypothetical protein